MRLGRRKAIALLLLGVVATVTIVYYLWLQEKPKEIGQVVVVYPDEQSFVLLSEPPILRAKEVTVLR
ncbi:hypothetical protein M6D81_16060 [Paenibacillus sp. J5C_2022]|uniref:hypothetical protein n=1 Tax=Paenibacillus sp. J5C2022 TaxID=2977129 RepID=UPI0021D22D2B|nr:hypothetical protein [Paenibacillus sp. J5C2022]MCU6710214.1 hypothetical protein [Paenibacillus sp. J5C2022]